MQHEIICSICGSKETIRSFAMHLRWNHAPMKTEEYVQIYGEFRPKKIENLNKISESNIICKECNEPMINNRQLMHHITKKHSELGKENYIIKHIYNGIRPKCKCNCGQFVTILPHGKTESGKNQYHVDYIKGHWDWIKPGYNSHSVITKDLMSEIAKERIKNEQIKNGGFANMHKPEILKERRIKRKQESINRLEKENNLIITNKEEIEKIAECKLFKCECKKCGYKWEQKSSNLRCVVCHPYSPVSKEEAEIFKFIKENYKGIILTNHFGLITNKEIDIYLPELNLGIEYNGLYWHSELFKDKDYHYNKFNESKDRIKLIQIFSDEWLNKKEIVKSRILNLLGKSIKIYARKCEIKEVDIKLKNEFLDSNHIQGKDKSLYKFGLYYNNELVSLMTFGKPRTAIGKKLNSNENEYELIRFCNKLNTNVVGGASKLLKHFIKLYSPKSIYSFADNRWSNPNNNIYNTLGFQLISQSLPGYWYTKNFNERHHRYNFRKQKLKELGCDISKTEWEIMEELKYYKVWDCGVSRYEMIFH